MKRTVLNMIIAAQAAGLSGGGFLSAEPIVNGLGFQTVGLATSLAANIASANFYTDDTGARYREMPDGTISWTQPENISSWRNYNGRCGETAAANIVSMISHPVSPNSVISKIQDYTPGTHPRTLARFLNENAPGIWSLARARKDKAYEVLEYALNKGTYKAKNRRAPVAVLLQTGTLTLHWATVVDLDASYVTLNQGGAQEFISWDSFAEQWGFAQKDLGTVAATPLVRVTCCQPFSFIYQTH